MFHSRNFILSLILCPFLSGLSQSQETPTLPIAPSQPANQSTRYYEYPAAGVAESFVVRRTAGNETDVKLQEALNKYREAESDSEARQQTREEIGDLLSQKYDQLLKNQEEELKQMEERLTKLRDQLKQRRDAKSKMVDLKLEMVIAQAEGLGWPEGQGGDWLRGRAGNSFNVLPLGNLFGTPTPPTGVQMLRELNAATPGTSTIAPKAENKR